MPVNFRTCRVTGITWCAIAGIDAVGIQRRAGHDDINTTLGYVKQAEDVGGRLGVPFAPLPATILQSSTGRVYEPGNYSQLQWTLLATNSNRGFVGVEFVVARICGKDRRSWS